MRAFLLLILLSCSCAFTPKPLSFPFESASDVRMYEAVTHLQIQLNDQRPEGTRFHQYSGLEQPFPDRIGIQFHAFGAQHDYELDVFPVFDETSVIEIHRENGVVSKHKPRINTYSLRTETSWVTVTLHEDGGFQGAVYDSVSGLTHFERLRQHRSKIGTETLRELEQRTVNDMVAFRDEDVMRQNRTCGAMSASDPTSPLEVSPAPSGRHLLAFPSKWTNCFTFSPAGTIRTYLGYATAQNLYAALGSSTTNVQNEVASAIALSNNVYYYQVDTILTVSTMVIKTAVEAGTIWNESGCYTVDSTLTYFQNWRAANYANTGATWALVSTCWTTGTVGLATVGCLCLNKCASVNGYHSGWWLTIAHEIGHNFAANHAFQEGQGTTGGIMDYGDGLYQGIYQFHTTYNKNEVCTHLNAAVSSTQTVYSGYSRVSPLSSCFVSYTNFCGDGYLSGSEQCDLGLGAGVNNACCVNCAFVSGAVCGGGDCCTSTCQFAASDTQCSSGTGYCISGACTIPAVCDYYGAPFCGMEPTNACSIKCFYGGSCVNFNTYTDTATGQPINTKVADGVACDLDPASYDVLIRFVVFVVVVDIVIFFCSVLN